MQAKHYAPFIPAPTLAPAGAGIPAPDRFVARRILLPIAMLRVPWSRTADLMDKQADELGAILNREHALAPSRATTPVLVPPMRGIEDSSRFWSLAMVAEHLRMVNQRLGDILEHLALSRPLVSGPNQIAQFKPDPGATIAALDPLHRTIHRIRTIISQSGENGRRSKGTVDHPWFGPLTAAQWAAFAPMHQNIHLKQAGLIVRGLDGPAREG